MPAGRSTEVYGPTEVLKVVEKVCRTVEELRPQGTRHSGEGVLEVVGLPGKAAACLVVTHSGKQLI
ncbi:hypothetical protein HaLaN_29818, partial [Haematococcus lacustris]